MIIIKSILLIDLASGDQLTSSVACVNPVPFCVESTRPSSPRSGATATAKKRPELGPSPATTSSAPTDPKIVASVT